MTVLRPSVVLLATFLAGCAASGVDASGIDASGVDASGVGVAASGGLRLDDAVALAASDDGTLWVVDAGTSTVVAFRDSAVVRQLGGAGTGAEALLDPVDVDPTNGLAIFVADRAAGEVVQFTDEGRVAARFVVPDVDPDRPTRQPAGALRDGARGQPLAVAAGADGTLFVIDDGRRHVVQLSAEGDVERVLGADTLVDPVDLALTNDGVLWVVDAGRSAVRPIERFGDMGPPLPVADIGRLQRVEATPTGVLVTGLDGIVRLTRRGTTRLGPFPPAPLRAAVEVPEGLAVLTPQELRVVPIPPGRDR